MTFKFESREFKHAFEEVILLADKVKKSPENYSETINNFASYIQTAKIIFNINIDLSNFDDLTSYSRAQPVSNFPEVIRKLIYKYDETKSNDDLEEIFSLSLNLFYIYLSELQFRIGGLHQSIGFEVNSLSQFISEYFKDHPIYARYLKFADRDIPFKILQEILNTSGLKNLNTTIEKFNAIEKTLRNWDKSLSDKEAEVTRLEKSLESYKDAFNFVGIFEGFNKLHVKKENELWWSRIGLALIGCVIFGTFAYELHSIKSIIQISKVIDIPTLLAITIPFTLLIFLLLYFFKIILQTMRSVQSQLLQLDLRMTLCRFIQSYAEYAAELKAKHPEGFEKFEGVIFSPLVSSDDKIPNTFDGLDQLSSVVNIVKGKDN